MRWLGVSLAWAGLSVGLFWVLLEDMDSGATDRREYEATRLGAAILLYAEAHDDRFPLESNWFESVQSTLGDGPEFQHGPYAFNARLSGLSTSAVDRSFKVVLAYPTRQSPPNAVGDQPADIRFDDGSAFVAVLSKRATVVRLVSGDFRSLSKVSFDPSPASDSQPQPNPGPTNATQ